MYDRSVGQFSQIDVSALRYESRFTDALFAPEERYVYRIPMAPIVALQRSAMCAAAKVSAKSESPSCFESRAVLCSPTSRDLSGLGTESRFIGDLIGDLPLHRIDACSHPVG